MRYRQYYRQLVDGSECRVNAVCTFVHAGSCFYVEAQGVRFENLTIQGAGNHICLVRVVVGGGLSMDRCET
jgi:hypothetical protein